MADNSADKTDLKSIIEAKEMDAEQVHEPLCNPCLFEKCEQNAIGFCKECTEYLCQECVRQHKKVKMTREHSIIEETLPNDLEIFKSLGTLMSCKEHGDTKISSKCLDHHTFACVHCITETHRHCALEECTRTKDRETTVESLFMSIDQVLSQSEIINKEQKECLKSTQEENDGIQSDVNTFVQRIADSVQSQGDQILEELQSLTTKRLSDTEINIKTCNNTIAVLTKYRDLLTASVSFCVEDDIYIASEVIADKVSILKTDIENLGQAEREKLHFQKSEHLLSSSIGELKQNSSKPMSRGLAMSSDEYREEKLVTQGVQTEAVENSREEIHVPKSSMEWQFDDNATVFTVKVDDEVCGVSGIVVLSNGNIVITDHNNRSLKMFTEDFSLTRTFDLEDYPISICEINEDFIAVSYRNMKRIDRFEIDDTCMMKDGGFQTKLFNICVAKYDPADNWCIAVLMSDRKIHLEKDSSEDILEIQFRDPFNGRCYTTLDTFVSFNRGFKSKLWEPNKIYFNEEGDLYIVEQDRLSCFHYENLSDEAEVKWYYKSKGVVTDVCIKDMSSIFYCSSWGIGQVSANNYRNTRCIEDKIVSPWSICLDSERKRLLVGCFADNYIHVYHYK